MYFVARSLIFCPRFCMDDKTAEYREGTSHQHNKRRNQRASTCQPITRRLGAHTRHKPHNKHMHISGFLCVLVFVLLAHNRNGKILPIRVCTLHKTEHDARLNYSALKGELRHRPGSEVKVKFRQVKIKSLRR